MAAPELNDPRAYAFFLDFDGTLAEISRSPDAVQVAQSTRCTLAKLHAATFGAVAIVSGREIAAIDGLLAPLHLPVAGVHGFERRTAAGSTVEAARTGMDATGIERQLSHLIEGHAGLLLEKKTAALSLHYRERPDLEDACLTWMDMAVGNSRSAVLTPGKMVIEARFHRATKGTAIMAFLQEEPFRGRIPVAAGDDVTDEDAFEAVNAAGGYSIKVGAGETLARHRVAAVPEFLEWLGQTAEHLAGDIAYG